MKPFTFSRFLAFALTVTLAATACKHTPPKVTRIHDDDQFSPIGGSKEKLANASTNDSRFANTPRTTPPGTPTFRDTPAIRTENPRLPTPDGPVIGSNVTPTNVAGTITEGHKTPDGDNPVAPPEGFEGWIEHPDALEAQSVYFDYDSAAVRVSEKSKPAAAADYLKKNKDQKIRIYGNCDERGTEEYNRSLGDRRAMALRSELIGLGVESERIHTVTNGKDKPRALGHDDAAWRENRRGDFVVLYPPSAP